MSPVPRSRLHLSLLLLLLVELTSCTTPAPDIATAGQPQQRLLAQADKDAREGRHSAAAGEYEQLAGGAGGELHDRFLLKAAREALRGNETPRADALLRQMSGTLPGDDFSLRARLAATVALNNRQPDAALAELAKIPEPYTHEVALEVLELRARAQFATKKPAQAVATALEREKLLGELNSAQVRANRRLIWDGLQQSAAAGADFTAPANASPLLLGWLELGKASLAAGRNPFTASGAVAAWQSRYPTHPANEFLKQDVLPTLGANLQYPLQIALVLPQTGRFQAAGIAVRDGFMAALYQQPAVGRPLVRIYDSAAVGALTAYQHAIADGARFVIGPLTKEEVTALGHSNVVSVPTLALNNLAETDIAPRLLFRFALDPEDEARQIAQKAVAEAGGRGIALLPNNDWGQRLYRAFDAEIKAAGGSLAGMKFYEPAAGDYSTPITSVLLIDESRARKNALVARLGVPLEFEPRARTDIGFVFMAAMPGQGRSLRPALRFHLSRSMPVYATSDIFEGDATANADLEGIIFPDMPWVISPDEISTQLRSAIASYWPSRARGRARLYAFGFDAYRLVPALKSEKIDPLSTVPGLTGRLSVDVQGRIHRQLDWAQIVDGKAQALSPGPAADSPQSLSAPSAVVLPRPSFSADALPN